MKRQPYFYRPILAAIAATVAGMNLSAGAAMLPASDLAAPAPAAVFNPATLSPAYGARTLLLLSGTVSPTYVGTSNPGGTGNSSTITVSGYLAPGLLNNIAPGNASDGMVNITGFGKVQALVVAAAISVSDSGNAALHAPSARQIADIVFDLDNYDGVGGLMALAEPFNGNTSKTLEYDNPAAYTLLASTEAADGGQPFSLAAVVWANYGYSPLPPLAVGFNFGSETVDGITAVDVTDIGVVPEPAGAVLLLLGGLPLLGRRRSCSVSTTARG